VAVASDYTVGIKMCYFILDNNSCVCDFIFFCTNVNRNECSRSKADMCSAIVIISLKQCTSTTNVAFRQEPFPIIRNDPQGLSSALILFKCNFLYSYAADDNISTDTENCVVIV